MRTSRPGPALVLFLLHVAVALAYRFFAGLEIGFGGRFGRWDWFWQTLRMEDLRSDLMGSLWHLHAQPPLLNLYGGVLGKLFYPHHLVVLGYLQIFAGGLAVVLCYRLLLRMTESRRVAAGGGLFLALLPGFFVYEAYLLYTLLAAFLVLLCIERLARTPDAPGLGPLYGFVAALCALILLRSAFHLALLGIAVPFGCLLAKDRWPRFLAVALLISSPCFLWYGKNLAQFDFFGSSSWGGQGLFRVVSVDRSWEELQTCDPMVVEQPAFSAPSAYKPYGFDGSFDAPSLSQDDFHNGNVPAISKVYGEASAKLIQSDPWAWLENGRAAYAFYCAPSARFKQVEPMAEAMGWHERSYLMLFTIGGLTEDYGSIYYTLIPLLLALAVYGAVARCRLSPQAWTAYFRSHPAGVFGWFLVVYTTLVGCLFEFGENERFKFMIEPLFLVLVIAQLRGLFARKGD